MSCAPVTPPGLEAALRRHDSRLRLRWDHRRCVWAIDEIGAVSGRRMLCFYWETPGGSYRPLPGSPDPILSKLADYDMTRFGGTNRQKMVQLTEQMDSSRRRHLNERHCRWANAMAERMDFVKRGADKKITLGPGGTRARTTTGNHRPGDPTWRSFVKEMQETSLQPEKELPCR
jgi:hypothetical protein